MLENCNIILTYFEFAAEEFNVTFKNYFAFFACSNVTIQPQSARKI